MLSGNLIICFVQMKFTSKFFRCFVNRKFNKKASTKESAGFCFETQNYWGPHVSPAKSKKGPAQTNQLVFVSKLKMGVLVTYTYGYVKTSKPKEQFQGLPILFRTSKKV